MPDLGGLGRIMIVLGLILVAAGALLAFGGRFFPLGRLPGDILIQRGNFTFYFPLASSIIVSILLSLVFFLISRR